MLTKNKDESWAAGLFGGTNCRMQCTAAVLGRRKEGFFFLFFLMSSVSVLIKHPFVFKQTLEWMKWPFPHEERWTLTRLVKNDCCILRIRCQCFDTIVSKLDRSCKSNWVWTHWEPVVVVTESHSVLLHLWMGFEPVPLGALTPTTLLTSIQRATWVFFHSRYPKSYWVHRGCFLAIPEWS